MAFSSSSSAKPTSIPFGNGLLIRPTADGGWEVCSNAECWPLNEQESWRAVALLEQPLTDVRAALARLGRDEVPLSRVVNAALSMSAHWAELALRWAADFTAVERQAIEPALRSVQSAPWAKQKLKHTARRLAKTA